MVMVREAAQAGVWQRKAATTATRKQKGRKTLNISVLPPPYKLSKYLNVSRFHCFFFLLLFLSSLQS